MAIPRDADARLFYRCAFQRYEEAQILLRAAKTTGAVYLAGYGIECILKALVLSVVSAGDRAETLRSFRGRAAHNYEWLRNQYRESGGAPFPLEINKHFTIVNPWSTDLRYTPRSVRAEDAEDFLESAEAVIHWAKEKTH